MTVVDTILEHHGVKGMRWGVRKDRGGGVTLLGRRRGTKPVPSEDKLKAEAARSKLGKRGNSDALSNDELRTLLNRMNQEQNLSKALANQKNNTVTAFIGRKLKETAAEEFQAFAQGKQTKIIGTAIALSAKGRHRKV
jgi:hypothetical protein